MDMMDGSVSRKTETEKKAVPICKRKVILHSIE